MIQDKKLALKYKKALGLLKCFANDSCLNPKPCNEDCFHGCKFNYFKQAKVLVEHLEGDKI